MTAYTRLKEGSSGNKTQKTHTRIKISNKCVYHEKRCIVPSMSKHKKICRIKCHIFIII